VRKELQNEIEKLSSLAQERGAQATQIAAHEVIVAQWVRFKCRFGCKGYGKHMSCPPYAPTIDETRRLLSEYTTGILLRFDGIPGHQHLTPEEIPLDFHPFFRDLILWVNSTVHFIEKSAFYDDFPKAFGFGAYPCIYCEHQHCVAEEHEGVVDESIRRLCRHMDLVRPTMEGAGIDVFATARNVGWDLHIVPCMDMEYGKIMHADIRSIGLVLIE
jgi:predicted metal-binding protein